MPIENNRDVGEERAGEDFTFRLHALRTQAIELAYDKASIEKGPPLKITTAAEQWSYAACIPIAIDRTVIGRGYIHVRAQVLAGQIGIGIYAKRANKIFRERNVSPTSSLTDMLISVDRTTEGDNLMLRNTASGIQSQIVIESACILLRAKRLHTSLTPDGLTLADYNAIIEQKWPSEVDITTGPQQWGFAAQLPLTAGRWKRGVILRIQAQVTAGQIGFGVLTPNRKAFIVEEIVQPSANFIHVDLPLPESSRVSDLIIRNTSAANSRSKVTVRALDLWEVQ